MYKIYLAVGNEGVENYIKSQKPLLEKMLNDTVNFVGVTVYKEGALQGIKDYHPDVVILREGLQGNIDILDLIYKIRLESSNTRIVFITKSREVGDAFLAATVQMGIYDLIIGDKISVKDLLKKIVHPTKFVDVAHYIPKLTVDEKTSKTIFSVPDVDELVKQRMEEMTALRPNDSSANQTGATPPVCKPDAISEQPNQPTKQSILIDTEKEVAMLQEVLPQQEPVVQEQEPEIIAMPSSINPIVVPDLVKQEEPVQATTPINLNFEKNVEQEPVASTSESANSEPNKRGKRHATIVGDDDFDSDTISTPVLIPTPVPPVIPVVPPISPITPPVAPNPIEIFGSESNIAQEMSMPQEPLVSPFRPEGINVAKAPEQELPQNPYTMNTYVQPQNNQQNTNNSKKGFSLFKKNKTNQKTIPSQIITFWGGNNGVGNSQIAFNTAIVLANKGYHVIYVDLNDKFSAIESMMQLGFEDLGVDTMLYNIEQGRSEKVGHAISSISKILPFTDKRDFLYKTYTNMPSSLNFAFFSQHCFERRTNVKYDIEFLKQLNMMLLMDFGYDIIILDAPSDVTNRATQLALAYSNKIFVTLSQDKTVLSSMLKQMKYLSYNRINIRDKCHFIINRFESNAFSYNNLSNFISMNLEYDNLQLLSIPNLSKDFINSIYNGTPIILSTKNKELLSTINDIITLIES